MSLSLTKLSYQACRDLGALRAGTVAVQAQDLLLDILDSANQMLDAWRIEMLMTYATPAAIFPLQGQLEQYQIGPGQIAPNFDAQRPDSIVEANVIINFTTNPTVRRGLAIWSVQDWANITVRATPPGSTAPIAAIPEGLYYDNGYDEATGFGTINLWPAPTGQPMQLEIFTSQTMPFTAFADLTTVYNFPPAYERLIRKSLAVEIWPMMWDRWKAHRLEGMQEPSETMFLHVKEQAMEAKALVAMNNQPYGRKDVDPAYRGSGNRPSFDYSVGGNGHYV